MNIKKHKFFLYFLFCIFAVQNFNCAEAAYDIINAKTISNQNQTRSDASKVDDYVPTYNDPQLPDFSEENSVSTKLEKKITAFLKNRKQSKSDNIEETSLDSTDESPVSLQEPQQKAEEIDESNRFIINADKVTYNEDDGNIYANGNVEIIADVQGITLRSDEAVLDKDSQTLKMSNNVKIIKDGSEMTGEFLLVNLNEQNILMDNPSLYAYQFVVKAQEAFLIENNLQMINGVLSSDKRKDFALETRGFQQYENVSLNFFGQNSSAAKVELPSKQVYEVRSKEIVLTSYKDHNSILLKKSDVYYNKHKVIKGSDIEIISDKQRTISETNAPEAGNFRNFGMYLGYGHVIRLPKGQMLKVMPTLTYGNHNLGVGGILRYRTQNGFVEGGYNTSTTNLIVNGRYNFGRGFGFNFGRNSYISEGFMGSRRSGYAAQLEYRKSYKVDDLNLRFNHGVYAGMFSDYVKHKQESHAYATTRFRYIAEMRKEFFRYNNSEQDFGASISGLTQGAATVYGSGQTTGIVRAGSYVTTHLKRWESSIGYMLAGIHGDSPFRFDKYRYGKSSIMLNEKFSLTNKLALGYRMVLSPKKDNYERELITESRLYAIFGPQDLKLCVSYDFIRDIAHLDFLFLVGTNSSKIYFDKFITRNMDQSSKKDFYKSKPVKIVVPESI